MRPMNKPSDRIKRPTPMPAAEAEGQAVQQAITFQLPLLPDHMRALSNPIARSALFTVGNRKRSTTRPHLRRVKVAALNGIGIEYTGEQLFQDDHDVFMQVCHIARMHPLGTVVRFTAFSMIKRLGWTETTSSYERLSTVLDRLKATALHVTFELSNNARAHYAGSLIRTFTWREDSTGERMREWTVVLEKEIVALFPETGYSAIDWNVHRKLRPVAKWLHNFYSTHQYAYAYSLERLKELMKSEAKTLTEFKKILRPALEQLTKVGFFRWSEITDENMLQVIRVGYEDPDRAHFQIPFEQQALATE